MRAILEVARWVACTLMLLGSWVPAAVAAVGTADHTPVVPTMTVDFQGADVHGVARMLADMGGRRLVVDDDVSGQVTAYLEDVGWHEALETIASGLDLQLDVRGDVIHLMTAERRLAAADLERRLREGDEEASALETLRLRLRFAQVDRVASDLRGRRGETSGLLSKRGTILADPLTNTLWIRDVPERLNALRPLVEALDERPAQLLIESEIVEATTDAARSLGVQWGVIAGTTGSAGLGGSGVGSSSDGLPLNVAVPAAVDATAGSAFDLALGALDDGEAFRLRLTALERDGRAKIISRPRVVTLNSMPATIKSLTVIRVKLPSTDTVVQSEAAPTAGRAAATEKIEAGIVLVVTPRIADGGWIVIDLFVKSSQADFSREVDGIPTETSREATTQLLVRDGETVVLGGIYTDSVDRRETGVPFLRSIPVFGRLFRGEEEAHRREDLLVFLTPRVLSTVGSPAGPLSPVPEESDWNDG